MIFRCRRGRGGRSAPSSVGAGVTAAGRHETPEARPARVHRLPDRVVRHDRRRSRIQRPLPPTDADGGRRCGGGDRRLTPRAAAAAAGDHGGGHRHGTANLAISLFDVAAAVLGFGFCVGTRSSRTISESPQSRCLLREVGRSRVYCRVGDVPSLLARERARASAFFVVRPCVRPSVTRSPQFKMVLSPSSLLFPSSRSSLLFCRIADADPSFLPSSLQDCRVATFLRG